MKARLIAAVVAVAAVVALVVAGAGQFRGPSRSSRSGASIAPARQSAPASRPASVTALSSAATLQRLGPRGTGWKLKFASNFSGSQLDSRVWDTCYPWVIGSSGCTNFGNSEYEWYLPGQVSVSGRFLHLVARRVPTPGRNASGKPKEYACRSGMVTTYPGFRFRYGYVQVVARIPDRVGLWPALWLAAANFRWPPEIDLLEHWGPNFRTGVYLHPVSAPPVIKHVQIPNLASQWHTFAVSWTYSRIVWYIDGHTVLTVSKHIPHTPMYFIANVADYKLPAGQGCDGAMSVRSVDVWQR